MKYKKYKLSLIVPMLLGGLQVFANQPARSGSGTGTGTTGTGTSDTTGTGTSDTTGTTNTTGRPADNTKINERDRSARELTSDNQPNSERDLQITSRIRQEIMNDKNLSTYAQNVKIVTQNGTVTLKGPVRSANERNTILKLARSAAGNLNVNDEMDVVTK
jgi:hyperosmotically inducible periplasmic protein